MTDQLGEIDDRDWRMGSVRIIAAFAAAAILGVGCYWLLEATQPDNGLISFSFLLILPAAVCALACYVADPFGDRDAAFYRAMPIWTMVGVVAVSVFFLREGVICIILLSPLWCLSGLAGAMLTLRLRKRLRGDRSWCCAILLAPLLAMQLEPMIQLPESSYSVARSIVIEAEPARIWPLLRGIPDVKSSEGRWNFSQDLIGIPRPLGAQLLGEGIGATRLAHWQHGIDFRERIIEWQPGRRIGWTFDFGGSQGWHFTDRHLRPDSAYFRVTRGGYTLEPFAPGRTRITLDTQYAIRTPVNGYSALWGELFLGDVENNLLAVIKQRAERPVQAANASASIE